VEPTCEKFHKWQKAGIPLTKVRCDNAGENTNLESRIQSKDWKLDLDFEFPPGTLLSRTVSLKQA
jgi:hypothetical protein